MVLRVDFTFVESAYSASKSFFKERPENGHGQNGLLSENSALLEEPKIRMICWTTVFWMKRMSSMRKLIQKILQYISKTKQQKLLCNFSLLAFQSSITFISKQKSCNSWCISYQWLTSSHKVSCMQTHRYQQNFVSLQYSRGEMLLLEAKMQ